MFSPIRSRRSDQAIAARRFVGCSAVETMEPRRLLSGNVAPPVAPSDLSATPDARSPVVRLTWTDHSGKEAGFTVQRKKGRSGAWLTVATLPANTTYFRDARRLAEGAAYSYRVAAFNRGGTSAFTPAVGATTWSAPSPTLDPSFGVNGDYTEAGAAPYDIAISPDGTRVYVNGGQAGQAGYVGPVVAALPPTGDAPDASFAAGGHLDVNASLPTAMGTFTALAVQPDGKLLVAGTASSANTSAVTVARFNADGSLDTSFNGGAGELVTAFGGGMTVAGVAVAPGGAIYVGGSDHQSGTGAGQFFAVRLNADGTIDRTYGSNGISEGDAQGSDSYHRLTASGMAVDPADGSVVLVGTTELYNGTTTIGGSQQLAGARFLSDGTVTDSFTVAAYTRASGVLIQRGGKIVVAGLDLTGATTWRFNADGTPDSTWTGPSFPDSVFNSLAALPDGSLIVAGERSSTDYDEAVVGHLSGDNGSLIGTFALHPIAGNGQSSNSTYYAVATAPDGSIFAAGLAQGPLLVSKYVIPT